MKTPDAKNAEPIAEVEANENTHTHDDPDETRGADLAQSHYDAHCDEANGCNMSCQQYAMKHKHSPGVQGHRARMVMALHQLRHADAGKELTK